MNQEEIEKEIQARVEFKMNELLIAVQNTAKTNWELAFNSRSAKHTHYWEAFNQFAAMLKKEAAMATPCNEMHVANKRFKRDRAIDKIMERLVQRGTRDYHQKEKFLVSIIEDAQDI